MDQLDLNNLNEKGCAKLVHAVVNYALHPPSLNCRNKLIYNKAVISRKLNIRFATDSPLLIHFCDIYDLDFKKVQSAIIRLNRIPFNHNLSTSSR
jgi:hypothetical protein